MSRPMRFAIGFCQPWLMSYLFLFVLAIVTSALVSFAAFESFEHSRPVASGPHAVRP